MYIFFNKVDLVCGTESTTIYRTTKQDSYKWYKQYVDFEKAAGTECKVCMYFQCVCGWLVNLTIKRYDPPVTPSGGENC